MNSDSESPWLGAPCAKCGAFIPFVEAPPAPPGLDIKKILGEGTLAFPGSCDACGHADVYTPDKWSMRMVRTIVRPECGLE
jgi:hypothetical protein